MTILITGAAGGIGSTLALQLINKNYKVIGFDNLNNGYLSNLEENGKKFCELIVGDIRDNELLVKSIEKYNVENIIHLAAISSLPACESNPNECFQVNVAGAASVLDAAKKCMIKRVIVASTSAIYENNNVSDAPFKETIQVNPRLFYPLSKKLMEDIVLSYNSNYNMDVVTLRFFNVFGPRQDIHRITPPLINYIVKQHKNKEKITFYSNGDQVRDYIHANDVTKCIEQCLKKENISNEIFNVCTETLTSVKNIIQYAEKAFNTKLNYTYEQPKNYWNTYQQLFHGYPLNRSVIEKEVNKFALGSLEKCKNILEWIPNCNIEELMIQSMRENYERY